MEMTVQNLVAGIGDFVVSNQPEAMLKTYALGSCVAIMIRDPKGLTTGLLHIALPDSSISQEKSRIQPAYFADLGIPLLIAAMRRKGMSQGERTLMVKITGGANVNDKAGVFDIGKRNILAVKKNLWKLGMGAIAEDVGGSHSRTVYAHVGTGKIKITSANRDTLEI